MQPRRHRMHKRRRRDAAREWIRHGAKVTVSSYAKRYGVDRYTAYEDLTALGVELPDSAQQWAQRPPAPPDPTAERIADHLDDGSCIMLDGRSFFVVGCTTGGAPFGIFTDEVPPYEDPA